MKVETILIPIDFSAHSEKALQTGIDLAKTFGARIGLVHCYPRPLPSVAPYGLDLPPGYVGELRHSALAHTNEWAEKVRASGVEAVVHVTSDPPVTGICEQAEALSADLIVMGTQGLSGLKHVLLGSVAERTIRQAACPVLVVKVDS